MRPVYFGPLVNGDIRIIPMDQRVPPPFQTMIQVTVTGAATYGVEVTNDNLFDPAVTPTWRNSDTAALNPGATATQRGLQTTPVTGVRVSMTAGAGSIAIMVQQMGPR